MLLALKITRFTKLIQVRTTLTKRIDVDSLRKMGAMSRLVIKPIFMLLLTRYAPESLGMDENA